MRGGGCQGEGGLGPTFCTSEWERREEGAVHGWWQRGEVPRSPLLGILSLSGHPLLLGAARVWPSCMGP